MYYDLQGHVGMFTLVVLKAISTPIGYYKGTL